MLKDFQPRLYQETILATAINNNTLVVLPTGMGKTAISLLLTVQRFKQYPNSKVIVLAPTRPLVEQHIETFKKHLEIPAEQMAVFTGMVSPEKRGQMWNNSKVIFCTPQGLENDVISSRINLGEVSLMVFDEAHRATGDYAYAFIASQYYKKARFPKILALTASPGVEMEKIKEVIKNLFIEELEVRTEDDPDVKPYIKEVDIEWIKVNLPPPFEEVQKFLKDFIKDRIARLKSWGVLGRQDISFVNKTDLLKLQAELRGRAASGEKDFVIWTAISVLAEIMKVQHGLELLETQGVIALNAYFEKLQKEGISSQTKAIKNLLCDVNFKSALIKVKSMFEYGFQHPKLIELQKLVEREVKNNSQIKIIIFNQYRDNAANIVQEINKIESVSSRLFVGQQKKNESGLSQKQQKEMLDEFREGKFNVLVATSVGEEGLDIPKVDLVVFFEPIPSAIRHIQRRGRTGRQEKGRVIVLMTSHTRDEGYKWSAHHKEKKMYRNLAELRKLLKLSKTDIPKVECSQNLNVKIFADYREKSSGVIKELIDNGVELKLEQLNSADYILSGRCGVEFKTVEDFAASLIDGRLLDQAKNLKNNFERPLIVVEGEQDLYSARNIHANAIRGMLATIAISFGIPLMFTKNSKDTAAMLQTIAKREQEENCREFSMHSSKKTSGIREQQEYVISSLPNIGPGIAKELLRHFKSVKNVINADKEELKKVEKVGEKIAEGVRNIVDADYEG